MKFFLASITFLMVSHSDAQTEDVEFKKRMNQCASITETVNIYKDRKVKSYSEIYDINCDRMVLRTAKCYKGAVVDMKCLTKVEYEYYNELSKAAYKEYSKGNALAACSKETGQSIQCPEGTYKFIGNNSQEAINQIERSTRKEQGSGTPVKSKSGINSSEQ